MTAKKHFMFLLLAGIIAVMAMGSVSAATGDKYVNGSVTASGTGDSWEQAYKTIQEGLDNVANGGTVNIASGTYTGPKNTNLDVNKNVTIKGAGIDKTVIDPRGNGRAFSISSGKNVTIQNLTIKRGSASNGGAILNRGKLNVTNVKFTNNRARYSGGAIFNLGTLTVANSTFKDNRAYWGGAIWSSGTNTAIITGSTFRDNTARYGGAIYNTGTLTVTGSTFRDNIARYGGAIYNLFGTLSIKYSAIVDNWRNDIYMNRGTLDARYNWWGTNFRGRSNPFNTGRIRAAFTMVPRNSYAPWLVLSIKADPTTINTFGSSKITADLYTDSAGGNHQNDAALYPAQIPIRFTTDLGSIGSRTVNTFLESGIASVTLKANYRTGKAHITARVDDQMVRIAVTIRRSMDPGWGYIQCPHIGIFTQCCREHQQPPNTIQV